MLCPHETRQLINLTDSFQLANLMKTKGRKPETKSDKWVLLDPDLPLQGRGPYYLRSCRKESHCRLSAALDRAPEPFHFIHLHIGILTADLYLLSFLSSQFLHYDIATACFPVFSVGQVSWLLLLLPSLGPWSTDSSKRLSSSPTYQLCGPHAYQNQPAYLPTSCTQSLSIPPW